MSAEVILLQYLDWLVQIVQDIKVGGFTPDWLVHHTPGLVGQSYPENEKLKIRTNNYPHIKTLN